MSKTKTISAPYPFSITDPHDFRHDLGYHGTLFTHPGSKKNEPDDYAIYAQDAQFCGDMFKLPGFDLNKDETIVTLKIYAIDAMNSTNLSKQRKAITVGEIARCIVKEKQFDKWLKNGKIQAVTFLISEVSRLTKNKLEIFSFASKYCFYHYFYLYQKPKGGIGPYSIYDSLMLKYLKDYPGWSLAIQDKILKTKGAKRYVLYNKAIKKMLTVNGCKSRDSARRELDQLVWWEGRKKDQLNALLDNAVVTYDAMTANPSKKKTKTWKALRAKKKKFGTFCLDSFDFQQVLKQGFARRRVRRKKSPLSPQQIWNLL